MRRSARRRLAWSRPAQRGARAATVLWLVVAALFGGGIIVEWATGDAWPGAAVWACLMVFALFNARQQRLILRRRL